MSSNPSRPANRWRSSLAALAYNLLLLLLSPLLALYLLWRLVVRGKSREGFRQRLGLLPETLHRLGAGPDPVIWVQAVSVGEVAAIAPFLRRLRLLHPMAHIVLSTTTPTGQRLARSRLEGEVDAIFYFPFDLPFVVQHVLSVVNPRLLVLVETELWPNLLHAAHHRGVRVALINGRISDRAYRKDLLARPILAWALRHLDLICAQSELDADRFRKLGARPEHIEVMGNIKFDEAFPEVSPAEAAKWRQDLGLSQEAPLLLAGSTHPGEEAQLLDLYMALRRDHRELQLLLAPRHPERGDEIEQLIHDHGYGVYRRSRVLAAQDQGLEPPGAPAGAEVRVILLDTIGEQGRVFAVGTVIFMGGSLVPRGGHNLLQPLALGCAVLFGPYMANFRDLTEIVLREQAGLQVRDAEELGQVVSRLLESPEARGRLGEHGQALIAQYRGASDHMAEHVAELI